MTVQMNVVTEQPEAYAGAEKPASRQTAGPRRSMVRVHFPRHGSTLTYYNDQFDLHRGDIVFVEGAREGLRGCVEEVNYHFRVKLSDYKRVIAVADLRVSGQFYQVGSYFAVFDPEVLPGSQVATWYLPPKKEEAYVTGSDGSSFCLDEWTGFSAAPEIVDRGRRYYMEHRVVYLSVDGKKGYAIVEGSRPYEVEFRYEAGEISELFCNCPCSFSCKHEVAVLLQLRETLELIGKHYGEEYQRTGYFAAVSRTVLLEIVDKSRGTGTLTL